VEVTTGEKDTDQGVETKKITDNGGRFKKKRGVGGVKHPGEGAGDWL